MGRYILTLLGLVCITSFVACAPLSQKSTPLSTSTLKPRQSAPQCGFEGNPDFYGLGIRIGVYLQWITAFSANHLLEEAIDGNLETNTIFLLALFIATLVTTVQGGVRIAELIVLLHLSFGFLFSILSIWGHRVSLEKLDGKKIRFPLIGSFFRLTLATAVSAYALWFWFSDSRLHGGPASCADFTFFFAKLDIAANIRTFFEIQTSLVLATFAILFVRELIMIICFFVFMSVQTVIISGIAVWFGAGSSPEKREKIRQRREKFDAGGLSKGQRKRMKGKYAVILDGGTGLLTMFKQWYRLSFAMGWKQLNGKESAGANRPDLRFYLIPFLDVWLFLMRSTIQFLCLLFFKKCPKVDFIPLMNHPLWSSDKDTTWKKFNVKLRDYYESKYTQKLIYTANAICIVWTIISVELTLYWNGITDVYTLNSTGQLIPFIIGAVGFVRLLHGLSVVRSKVSSTDVLLSLIDVEAEEDPKRAAELLQNGKQDGSNLDTKAPEDEIFPINDRYEAIFWVRKPPINTHWATKEGSFYQRRNSFYMIKPWHVDDDNAGSKDFDSAEDHSHGIDLHDYDALREVYGWKNIDVHQLKGRKEVYFIKDFRKRRGDFTDSPLRRTPSPSSLLGRPPGSSGRGSFVGGSSGRRRNRGSEHSRTRSSNNAVAGESRSRLDHHARSRPRSRTNSQSRGRPDPSSKSAPSARSRSLDSEPRSHSRSRATGRHSSRESGSSRSDRLSYQPSNHSTNYAHSEGGSKSNMKDRLRIIKSIWGFNKFLAIILFSIFICFILPFLLLLVMIFKILKRPILKCGALVGPRFMFAVTELGKMLYSHYFSSGGKHRGAGRTSRAKKEKVKTKPKQNLPHRQKIEPIRRSEWSQLSAAWSSQSMPILVNTTTDVLLAVTERVKLPLSKRYVTSISQFYNEARIVRKERREKKIGLQRQHEILADKWNSLIGSGMTQSVVEEIGGIGKGDEEKVKLGQNENKEDEGGSGMGDGLGESDNEGNAMDLVRWFSWAGAEDSAPWGGEEEEEPQVDHG